MEQSKNPEDMSRRDLIVAANDSLERLQNRLLARIKEGQAISVGETADISMSVGWVQQLVRQLYRRTPDG